MDREEKLRAAKERLKKFQKKRHNETSSPIQTNIASKSPEKMETTKENTLNDHLTDPPNTTLQNDREEGEKHSTEIAAIDTTSEAVIDVSKPNAHDFNELLRNVEHLKNTSMNMNVHQQGLYNDQNGAQISQTQFESREQLQSAFAAYEENQLQKLKEDNVLGVINFEIDKGSISNLNSQFDESSTMEEKVNMLDGIDLKMNIIPPAQPAIGPVMNNDFKATTHQSLSEQIAGVLSKSSDAMEESTNEVNTMPLSFEGEATDRSSVHNPIPAPQAIPFLNSAHQNNHELSSLREQLENMKKEKQEMQSHMQQQASSILHFKAYCKSVTTKLEDAEATLEKERLEAAEILQKQVKGLQEQMKSQLDSLEILVEAKSSLEKNLDHHKMLLKEKEDEVQEMRKQLNDAQAEKQEVDFITSKADSVDRTIIDALKREGEEQKEKIIDLTQEVAEFSSKFMAKEQEVLTLTSELSQSKAKLEMVEVNLLQLRSVNELNKVDESNQNKGDDSDIKHVGNEHSKKETNDELKEENENQRLRINELTLYIQQAAEDREQIIHQYTSYSQQLTTQIEALTKSLNDTKLQNHNVALREAELIKHVQQLEEQLQKMIQNRSQDNVEGEQMESNSNSGNESVINELNNQLNELKNENEQLREHDSEQERKLIEQKQKLKELGQLLEEKAQMVSDMETQLEMESEKPSGQFDSNFMAACESDKVAASRAVAQNQQLKEQLEELELAVIQITNSKAELANELDSIRKKFEKTKEEETKLNIELTGLRDGIKERDRNMTAMKEQMKYYINFAENSIHGHLDGKPRNMEAEHEAQVEALVKEMQLAKEEIRNLSSHNSELRSQLEVLAASTTEQSSARSTRENSGGPNTPIVTHEPDEAQSHAATRESSTSPSLPSNMSPKLSPPSGTSTSSELSSTFSPLQSTGNSDSGSLLSQFEVVSNQTQGEPSSPVSHPPDMKKDDVSKNKSSSEDNTGSDSQTMNTEISNEIIPPLSPEVALLKLQQKFRKAMQDNVELSTEKEQLEHLVVQLQEETDTIGEYITIYQHQRQQQRLNLAEKEAQLQALSRDREELKAKLNELQQLVKHFLKNEKRLPRDGRSENRDSLFSNGHMVGSSLSLSNTSGSSEINSLNSSGPSTPRNTRLPSPNVMNAEANQINGIDLAKEAIELEDCKIDGNGMKEGTHQTKAVIINDKDGDNDFTITSIPEGSDLRDNMNGSVGEFRTIVMPESESNSAEEVIIVPQSGTNFNVNTSNTDQQTADKILALISEIGSNQILQKDERNFHPWFWDQSHGQVITI